MAHSGDICLASGAYEPSCRCRVRERFVIGDLVPCCPFCREPVEWIVARDAPREGAGRAASSRGRNPR